MNFLFNLYNLKILDFVWSRICYKFFNNVFLRNWNVVKVIVKLVCGRKGVGKRYL